MNLIYESRTDPFTDVLFTAPNNGTSADVKVTVRDVTLNKTFIVKEPSGYDPAHTYIISTHTNDYQPPLAGAAMSLNLCIAPVNVSFYKVQIREVSPIATDPIGYFTNFTSFPDRGAGIWENLDENNMHPDDCDSGILNPPWSSGSFSWNYDVKWKVGDNGATNPMAGWNQDFIIYANGTVSITKYGKSVLRSIDNIVIPSL